LFGQKLAEEMMSRESRMFGGILFVVLPTVVYGGLSLLGFLTTNAPGYADNPMRHDLWRTGHAMAGVFIVLSLIMLVYVDDAALSSFWKWLARTGTPIAAILVPAAFFPVYGISKGDAAKWADEPRTRGSGVPGCRCSEPRGGLIRAARRMETMTGKGPGE
jgi:hypothetical protein